MDLTERYIEAIDREIENARAELARDTIRLVNIKSTQGEAVPGAPFGEGPRAVLDAVLEMSAEEGFHTVDYGVGVVSAALKEGQPDLGVWAHGDVVPEGDGWSFDPYNAVEYKGCIVGRGATDNKGQLVSIFHLLRIFRKLNIPLKYNPALYVGSNEETGMKDLAGVPGNDDAWGFCNGCTPPKLSLVPDGSFPVGYGGKGGIHLSIKSKLPLNGITLSAGRKETPGKASAILKTTQVPADLPDCEVIPFADGVEIITQSPPGHSAHPKPGGNMITKLMNLLLDYHLAAEEDRQVLEFIRAVSLDITGSLFGIDVETAVMSPLTLATLGIDTGEDGCPELRINIRYPIELTSKQIAARIGNVAERNGMTIGFVNPGVEPYLLDPNWPVIGKLNAIANEVTGKDKAPYTLSGGTYAHRLPNALVYGMNGCKPPEDFPEGRGGAHGIDEVVSLDRLQRAMRIYARAMLALNDMEW